MTREVVTPSGVRAEAVASAVDVIAALNVSERRSLSLQLNQRGLSLPPGGRITALPLLPVQDGYRHYLQCQPQFLFKPLGIAMYGVHDDDIIEEIKCGNQSQFMRYPGCIPARVFRNEASMSDVCAMVERLRTAPIREVPEHEQALAELLEQHKGKINPTFDTLQAGNMLTVYLLNDRVPEQCIVWGMTIRSVQ